MRITGIILVALILNFLMCSCYTQLYTVKDIYYRPFNDDCMYVLEPINTKRSMHKHMCKECGNYVIGDTVFNCTKYTSR